MIFCRLPLADEDGCEKCNERKVQSLNKKTPPLVVFLGKMLPSAVMGMLVVYSLKDTQLLSGYHGLPEAIAVALTVILQATVRNLLLTIATGTIGYMLLVQYIFV